MSRWKRVGPALIAAAMLVSGCAGEANLRLVQPGRAGAQSDLNLRTESAEYATDAAGVTRICLSYPLPGARAGRDYRVYLRVPAAAGRWEVGQELADGGFVGGFLIQSHGSGHGLTEFASGEVELSGGATAATRAGRFKLKCGDGSVASGEFTARRDDKGLAEFERREHAGDVGALVRGRGAVKTN